jgi:hypothetical protein
MKKVLTSLFVCAVFSVAIVISLGSISKKLSHQYSGFNRILPPHPIDLLKDISLKDDSYNYIAGETTTHIYLGSTINPLHLLQINIKNPGDTMTIRLTFENGEKNNLVFSRILVDSSFVYLLDGIKPAIFKGSVNNFKVNRYMYDSAYFVSSVPISPNSFVIRTLSSKLNQYVLAKESAQSPNIKLFPNILEKQIDGIFCTDGTLNYSAELSSIIYVYRYRNQFLRLDTNLSLLYKGKTIDTVSRAKISVANLTSENAFTISSPPLSVNNKSYVANHWLFIHSNLLAKNEDKDAFDASSVIDVYNLKSGKYNFSFYLFNHGKSKMRDFKIINNKLIVLYNKTIYIYDFNKYYFKD